MSTPYTPVLPKLGWLPKPDTEYVLDGLKNVFLTDTVLQQGAGQSTIIRAWDGDPIEEDDPNEDELPLIRISPSGDGRGWVNEGQQEFGFVCTLDLYVAGVNLRDLMRLESAVWFAIFPQNSTRRLDVGAMMAGKASFADPNPAQATVVSGSMRRLGFNSVKRGETPYAIHGDSLLDIRIFRNS